MRFREIPATDRPAWLQWRHGGVGSSDAGAIMGVSRFKTRAQTLLEKCGIVQPEDTKNDYIKNKGNNVEKYVREFLEIRYSCTFAPVSVELVEAPFIRASLDGASPDRKMITEIKLLSSVRADKVNVEAEGYKKWVAATKGKVPDEYYPQIQHQLFITGADVCLFAGFKEVKGEYTVTDEKLAVVEVYPDKCYIEQLMVEEFQFWNAVVLKKFNALYRSELE